MSMSPEQLKSLSLREHEDYLRTVRADYETKAQAQIREALASYEADCQSRFGLTLKQAKALVRKFDKAAEKVDAVEVDHGL